MRNTYNTNKTQDTQKIQINAIFDRYITIAIRIKKQNTIIINYTHNILKLINHQRVKCSPFIYLYVARATSYDR